MTYVPTQRRSLGDDEGLSTISTVIAAFMPKINEIQAAGDANAEAQVAQTLKDAGVGAPTAPVTTTKSGSTSTSSVTAADFKIVGSVAKPQNFPALAAAKDLQMQLNRVAKAKGFGTISVDGAIGPGTIALLNKGAVVGGFPPTSTVADVITHVPSTTANVKALADKIGAPPPTAPEVAKAASAGSIVVTGTTGGTQEFKPPGAVASIGDKLKSLPETVKIVGGGALVLGGILLFKKLRAGRRASSSSPAPSLALPAAVANPFGRRARRRRR